MHLQKHFVKDLPITVSLPCVISIIICLLVYFFIFKQAIYPYETGYISPPPPPCPSPSLNEVSVFLFNYFFVHHIFLLFHFNSPFLIKKNHNSSSLFFLYYVIVFLVLGRCSLRVCLL